MAYYQQHVSPLPEEGVPWHEIEDAVGIVQTLKDPSPKWLATWGNDWCKELKPRWPNVRASIQRKLLDYLKELPQKLAMKLKPRIEKRNRLKLEGKKTPRVQLTAEDLPKKRLILKIVKNGAPDLPEPVRIIPGDIIPELDTLIKYSRLPGANSINHDADTSSHSQIPGQHAFPAASWDGGLDHSFEAVGPLPTYGSFPLGASSGNIGDPFYAGERGLLDPQAQVLTFPNQVHEDLNQHQTPFQFSELRAPNPFDTSGSLTYQPPFGHSGSSQNIGEYHPIDWRVQHISGINSAGPPLHASSLHAIGDPNHQPYNPPPRNFQGHQYFGPW
ncbi:uncharacterized protein JCM15063_000969 [Sporobolomyces koalae]|uniref:uncharacterized protein n=1 Tax=Sporobolomyces koalae TaxID=500713 RepID=UPI0031769475